MRHSIVIVAAVYDVVVIFVVVMHLATNVWQELPLFQFSVWMMQINLSLPSTAFVVDYSWNDIFVMVSD